MITELSGQPELKTHTDRRELLSGLVVLDTITAIAASVHKEKPHHE